MTLKCWTCCCIQPIFFSHLAHFYTFFVVWFSNVSLFYKSQNQSMKMNAFATNKKATNLYHFKTEYLSFWGFYPEPAATNFRWLHKANIWKADLHKKQWCCRICVNRIIPYLKSNPIQFICNRIDKCFSNATKSTKIYKIHWTKK